MSKFKVGDRVRISVAGRGTYPNSVSNPHDAEGVYILDDGDQDYALHHKVRWDNGIETWYRANQIEPIPTTRFKVGETYTGKNGTEWECIYINDTHAWLKHVGIVSAAYAFSIDGSSPWDTAPEYQIVFPPVIETKHHAVTVEGNRLTIVYKVIDGKPDTDNAQLVPF